jgi:hypothetical protein
MYRLAPVTVVIAGLAALACATTLLLGVAR